jgi:peptidoglycan hydrolase-like protein with peptidoglycan-binding domain
MALTNPRFSTNHELVAAANSAPSLRKGAKGEAVAILQQALLDLGFAMPLSTSGGRVLPDGAFGTETEGVAKLFQRRNGLLADGIVGRETLKQLELSIRAFSEAEDARFKLEFINESRGGGQVG